MLASKASSAVGGSAPKPAAAPLPALQAANASSREKLEIEAQLALVVPDVGKASRAVTELVHAHGGRVQKEERSSAARAHGELLVRVPSERFQAFVDGLVGVGEIQNRRISIVDATLEHRDVEIMMANLEAAMARYRELLDKTSDPAQLLALERELERVRTQLDRVKGRLEWLRDRVAFATIAIALSSPQPDADLPPHREPILATAARGVGFTDFRESGTTGYLGAGLSLRLPQSTGYVGRGFVLDVDVLKPWTTANGDWGYNALVGADLYGAATPIAKRRWFVPYLGARLGFSSTQKKADLATVVLLGIEVFKSPSFVLDVQSRFALLIGNPDGPHGAISPTIGFDLAF